MPLRFAPAVDPAKHPTLIQGRTPAAARIAKAMTGRAIQNVANDNSDVAIGDSADDRVLRAALRHFAQHGLGAAREARNQAERAFFNDDRAAYDWWLGITRALDRRLAQETEATGATDPGIARP
ncbi:hypothetical protein [Erythrobacter sp. Alg231-14]|uniref:hypothetical protein n=1 Tax=Erythrobacter sp. Alg231-14 TaxID=1922225 RepID=UPI00307CACE3